MEKNHPEKPFERYADDIVIHCKTEKQAQTYARNIQKVECLQTECPPDENENSKPERKTDARISAKV